MRQLKESIKEPVTVVFSWTVMPEKALEFQNWMHKIHKEARRWPGHLGVTTLRPPSGRNDYHTVLRFDSYEHLENWLNSTERNGLMKSISSIASLKIEKASGLETWFDIPGQLVIPPPRWKMALTTSVAIYPIALVFAILVNPHITDWSVFLRAAMIPIFGPITLTYLFMPYLTQNVLRNWLYKKS